MGDVRIYEYANRSTIIYTYYMNPEYNTQIYAIHVL